MSLIKNSKIIIIDDSLFYLKFIERVLLNEGYVNIKKFQDPSKGTVEILSVIPDLIIVDLILEKITALDVIKKLKQNNSVKMIPVIVLSSSEDKSLIREALLLGADDFISKSKNETELVIRVKNLLNKEYFRKGLIRKQKELEGDIQIAAKLQKRMLPKSFPKLKNVSFSALYLPYHIASGDYYNIIQVGENQIFMMMADVSGHGVGATMLVVHLDILTKEFIKFNTLKTAEDLLKYASYINQRLEAEYGEISMFIASFLGIIDVEKNELIFITASCPHPLVIKDDKVHEIEVNNSTVLGIFPDYKYKMNRIPLDFKKLLVFTDGIYEIAKPNQQDIMDIEGLQDVIQSLLDEKRFNLKNLYNRIAKEYEFNFEDDITIITINRN